ncbi:AbrB/MazE/SpoVT family DNA-binding domain-containing protein [Paenibacillus sp. OAE614]|uniref:AbrB/MazE/SpoVT family DNA-binding domain-containing protein n=1 Tax=Paenibacillus sp. OAE614 TaxID=2663804 RepID=UPI00178B5294
MRFSGIVREVDELGRISVPSELRDRVGLNDGEPFEIFCDDDSGRLIIRRYQPFQCIFRGSMEGLLFFQRRFICGSCLNDFSADQEIAVATENETIVQPNFSIQLEEENLKHPGKNSLV